MSLKPIAIRLTKTQATTGRSLLAKAREADPTITLIDVVEQAIEDFACCMRNAHRISPATTDVKTLVEVEKVLASISSLLDAAVRNKWPLHTLSRSPAEDEPKLRGLSVLVSGLHPHFGKHHAIIFSTIRALLWMAKNNLDELMASVSAVANGGEMTEAHMNVLKVFASSLGLRVRSPFAGPFKKPEKREEFFCFRFSVKTRGWLNEIMETYPHPDTASAIRCVLDHLGSPPPTLIQPKLIGMAKQLQDSEPSTNFESADGSPAKPIQAPPLDTRLNALREWEKVATVALKNGRTPAVPVLIELTQMFDQTFRQGVGLNQKSTDLVKLCTTVNSNQLEALTQWCRGQQDDPTRSLLLHFFETLGLFHRPVVNLPLRPKTDMKTAD